MILIDEYLDIRLPPGWLQCGAPFRNGSDVTHVVSQCDQCGLHDVIPARRTASPCGCVAREREHAQDLANARWHATLPVWSRTAQCPECASWHTGSPNGTPKYRPHVCYDCGHRWRLPRDPRTAQCQHCGSHHTKVRKIVPHRAMREHQCHDCGKCSWTRAIDQDAAR